MTLPLESFRVLDLTRLLPGPYCTLLLADFGADVIKIEAPNGGDYAREEEPKIGDQEQSAIFASLNRNKRSVSIDLKTELGKKMFIDLVKTADVVVESFRPGVMKRLGLDYEELKKYNSKIIYCAITGYGQSGPYAEAAGHDLNYLSYSGMMNLQGERSGKPLLSSVQIADIGGGSLMAAIGILLSIIESKNSCKGQFIDISMLDGAVSWMQTILPNFFVSNSHPERGELPLNGGKACYEVYKTKDNRYLAVAALEEKFWIHFCEVIGKEKLIAKLNAPVEEQMWMKEEIQCTISKKSLNEWTELFKGIEACVSPVLTAEEMMRDPQIKHRRMIEEVDYPGGGMMKQLGIPIKLSRTEGEIRRPSPRLGEHNDEILRELGYSNEQIPTL
ncbi:CaiB/BaiF CoA-transferase family protein [Alteribacillus sp. YIM 98480]|uniref:CaiB/BaiF CoA transferase family protein n=1 Tax=Alteribacillus sp. YIM 98480 TaxID=2606599 RepID=UPI00131DAB02|nr:CaiB/BaiF CoA-transferase family protein [Alteribacillus sp. YIM 98480]